MRKQKTFSGCGMRKSSKIFRKLYLKMIAVPAEMHFFAKRYKTGNKGRQRFGLIIFLGGFVVSGV